MILMNLLLTTFIRDLVEVKQYLATAYRRVDVAIRVKEVETGKIGC
jgi:hypothetical protein